MKIYLRLIKITLDISFLIKISILILLCFFLWICYLASVTNFEISNNWEHSLKFSRRRVSQINPCFCSRRKNKTRIRFTIFAITKSDGERLESGSRPGSIYQSRLRSSPHSRSIINKQSYRIRSFLDIFFVQEIG